MGKNLTLTELTLFQNAVGFDLLQNPQIEYCLIDLHLVNKCLSYKLIYYAVICFNQIQRDYLVISEFADF